MDRHPSRRLPLLVLLLLFAGSGCAALIYEIVWYQMLQLAIGSTAVSMAVLLATFMGGLSIGSLGFPRWAAARGNPLRVYAYLELGIAACGLLVLAGLPLVNRIYISGVESGLPGMLLRGVLAALCMLAPTILMGASLPALARGVGAGPPGASWWGLLYGANTAGAVLGCLAAGFYLLRIYDTAIATYTAAAINVAVAGISIALSSRAFAAPRDKSHPPSDAVHALDVQSRWPIYLAIGLSGACALGAEVVWTRLMGYLLGATVYSFAVILAVFLIGLAIGSGLGSLASQSISARAALGWTQILLAGAIAWAAYMIADSLPYWPIDVMLFKNPWQTFQLDFVRCLWAILPPAMLWGASFPLACAAIAPPAEPNEGYADSGAQDSARLVGGIYAANTLGAIAGALLVSLVLIPAIGTQQTQRALVIVSVAGGLIVLAPMALRTRSAGLAIALAMGIAAALFLVRGVDAVPGALIAYGRQMPRFGSSSRIVDMVEGRNSSIAIGVWPDGATEIDVNGHIEATTEPFDMKLQRMVGHLPGILHPNPKSVLGIGFGAGVSAGTFTRYPTIQKITVCEIEPVIPPTSTRFFARENYLVYQNPKTRVVFDDARHYLLTTTEKFDIIASDPLDVFVKGTAALYSKEYFESVKRHLNPGGLFTLYVPLYETDLPTIKSEVATFFDAFPYGTLWANLREGQGYDMVFMGQAEPLKINVDEVNARLARPDYAPVAASLREIGISSPTDLFSTYAGAKPDLGIWLQGAEINRDRNLRLQYLAGWGINSNLQDEIYRQIIAYRRPPKDLFTGSDQATRPLLSSLR